VGGVKLAGARSRDFRNFLGEKHAEEMGKRWGKDAQKWGKLAPETIVFNELRTIFPKKIFRPPLAAAAARTAG